MPRTTKAQAKAKREVAPGKYSQREPGEVAWGGFINIKMDDEARLTFQAWLEGNGAAFWSLLTDVLGDGMKYGASWDAENDCFIATFTGCGVSESAERYCLTARAGTFEECTALLVFKHDVLAAGDWGAYRPRTGTMMSWG